MAPVKIKFVVSFSSQDKVQKVSNLLVDSGSTKRWLTDPKDRSGQIDAVFQLDRPCHIAYIDIGFIWCANAEVRVGKSDWPQGHSYVTLVPTQVLMSPIDSRLSRNISKTCMFSKAHFMQEGASDLSSWDRIQVIGRQPWRKDVQLGLSFIRIRGHDHVEAAPNSCTLSGKAGNRMGNGLTVADMEQHFFGKKKQEEREDAALKNRLQKIAASAEGVVANPNILSRNARMVLLANKNCSKAELPEEDVGSQQSASSDSQQEQTLTPEEVTCFLGGLSIGKEDLESLKVSDLRHRFEKQKWRKLTADEKRIFYNCCQDFIGRMFDDDANDAPVAGSAVQSKTAVSEQSSHQNNKHKSERGKANGVSGNGVSTDHRLLTDRKRYQECGSGTPKTSVRRAPNTLKISGDARSPRSEERLSGGFLISVYNMTDDVTDNRSGTPNKTANTSPGNAHHDTNNAPGTGQHPGSHTPPTPRHFNSMRKLVLPSGEENIPGGLSCAARQNRKQETGKSNLHKLNPGGKNAVMSPKHSGLQSKPSSDESVDTCKIDKSLLNTHRQFVRGRCENVSLSRPSKPGVSSLGTGTKHSTDHERHSKQSAPVQSPVAHNTPAPSAKGSATSAKKRLGAPLDMSENLIPAKQRPKFCSTPKGLNSASEEEEDGWLNAKHSAVRTDSRARGSSRNRQCGRSASDSVHMELENPSSPECSLGARGRGSRRGRGRGSGTAKRRLEMPEESTTSSNHPPSVPEESAASMHDVVAACVDVDSDDPFLGELQIDEDVRFVECPMCDEMFPADTVNTHAADCQGKQPQGAADHAAFVQCPLCGEMFSEDVIAEHASSCSL